MATWGEKEGGLYYDVIAAAFAAEAGGNAMLLRTTTTYRASLTFKARFTRLNVVVTSDDARDPSETVHPPER